jgi:hypothetical protein
VRIDVAKAARFVFSALNGFGFTACRARVRTSLLPRMAERAFLASQRFAILGMSGVMARGPMRNMTEAPVSPTPRITTGSQRVDASSDDKGSGMQNSHADMQNPDGDKIAAEAEFDMMKNINLLITEHCNLACMHCSTGAPFAKKISHPAVSFCKWLDLLESKQIPFRYISLTDGEPFLHPEVRDGSFIRLLRTRYPSKSVGVTTNFFWASEQRIIDYASIVRMLNGGLGISVYEPIVTKVGGLGEFYRLVELLRNTCPNTWITVGDRQQFSEWELHEEKREVKGTCCTSDCFVLKPNGKLSHCSVAIAVQNIPEYSSILKRSDEALLDNDGSRWEGRIFVLVSKISFRSMFPLHNVARETSAMAFAALKWRIQPRRIDPRASDYRRHGHVAAPPKRQAESPTAVKPAVPARPRRVLRRLDRRLANACVLALY